MNDEIDIISGIAASLTGGAVILVIMYVEFFKTAVIVFFICNVIMFLDVKLIDNFLFHSQFVDTDNITLRDQKKKEGP